MIKIKGKASQIRDVIAKIALPYQGSPLMNPIALRFQEGRVLAALQDPLKTVFVKAIINLGEVEGGDMEVVLDSAKLLKHLDTHPSDDDLTITIDQMIVIRGSKKANNIHPQQQAPTVPTVNPSLKDGILYYKDQPTTTFCTLPAAAMQSLIPDAKTVEISSFHLSFESDTLRAKMGGIEAGQDWIESFALGGEMKGVPASCLLGEAFCNVFANLSGSLQLQLKDQFPLGIVAQDEYGGKYLYTISPRRSDESEG